MAHGRPRHMESRGALGVTLGRLQEIFHVRHGALALSQLQLVRLLAHLLVVWDTRMLSQSIHKTG